MRAKNFNGLIDIRTILYISGILLLVNSFFMSITFFISIYYNETIVYRHLLSLLISLFSGVSLYLIFRKHSSKNISLRDSFLLVVLSWLILTIDGTLPYILTGEIKNFTDAFFESVSGYTTTGSSILTDIEALDKSVLFWRSATHWIGGLGIIVLFIGLFPSIGVGKIYLFNAEASVVVQEKVFPRIGSVARRLLAIYLTLTIVETFLLYLGGMPLFDSVCHSFATVATGGFSTKNTSIGNYSSFIQYVIAIFMVLSATNFNIYLLLLKKRFKTIIKNEEWRAYLGLLFIVVIIVSLVLYFDGRYSLEESFRYAFFNVSSLMTATGFATTDYLQWPTLAWILIVLVMFIGASSGSTGGGIKVIRYVILWKKIKNSFREALHNNLITSIKYNGQSVEDSTVSRILVFILVYLMIVFGGTLILISTGVDVATSFGSALTAMGGMGPGLGISGPAGNFSAIPVLGKYTLIFLMLLGRLEIFSVLVIFTRDFWS